MSIVERLLSSIDIDAITKDVMSKLVVKDLELFFVVKQFPDSDDYELVGMTYSKDAARELRDAQSKRWPAKIIQLDMGKLLKIVEDMSAIREVH